MTDLQQFVDEYYIKHGPCCAGCDWWRFYNSSVGECTKSAPVSSTERFAMMRFNSPSIDPGAGHVMTLRDHHCGDFVDTHDWPPQDGRRMKFGI